MSESSQSRRVGKYRVLKELGRGSFGITSLAEHVGLGTRVVLKEMIASEAEDRTVRDRFILEARTQAKLGAQHQGIAQVTELEEDSTPSYYIVEHCDLGDLATLVEQMGPFTVGHVVWVIRQVADALTCVHQEVWHRDIKPHNLVLANSFRASGEPVLKIIDFGSARLRGVQGADNPRMTKAGQMLGTVLFSAPEQLRNDDTIDGRCDLFSLGMTAWFLLEGRSPLRGNSGQILIERLSSDSYADALPSTLPPSVRRLLERLLEKNPDQRPGTAKEVVLEADRCLSDLSSCGLRPPSQVDLRPGSGVVVPEPLPPRPPIAFKVVPHVPPPCALPAPKIGFFARVLEALTRKRGNNPAESISPIPPTIRSKMESTAFGLGTETETKSGWDQADSMPPSLREGSTSAGINPIDAAEPPIDPPQDTRTRLIQRADLPWAEGSGLTSDDDRTLFMGRPNRDLGIGSVASEEVFEDGVPPPAKRHQAATLDAIKGVAGKVLSFCMTPLGGIALGSLAARLIKESSVYFSVTSAVQIRPGETQEILVWAHRLDQLPEVKEQSREFHGTDDLSLKTKGATLIAHGSLLQVELKVLGARVAPREDSLQWMGVVANASFRVSVPKGVTDKELPAQVLVRFAGFVIAQISFVLHVVPNPNKSTDVLGSVAPIRTAFASYANDDRDEVLGRIQGMQKMVRELDIFVDVAGLRSGDDWQARLRHEILNRDVLYLFWSQAAADSKWVDWEWRCALTEKGRQAIDPVPLVSPIKVSPPRELSALHFNDWVLAYRRSQPEP